MKNELVHGTAVAETDFGFGGVYVDVYRRRVDLEEDAIGRVAAAMQHVLVGFAQGVAKQLVAHETTIDVAILGIAART